MFKDSLATQPLDGKTPGRVSRACRSKTASREIDDTDELKALLLEKDILLREVNHRLKNDMATIASYLSLQADFVAVDSPARSVLLEAGSRVEGMARLYGHLLRSDDFRTVPAGIYIRETVEAQRAFNPAPDRVSLQVECEDFPLDSRILFPLGLAMDELVRNSFKHAFPGKRAGRIRVSLARAPDGRVLAEVADDGAGILGSAPNASGFGHTLVPALVAQLGGTLETVTAPDRGSAFRIRIPTRPSESAGTRLRTYAGTSPEDASSGARRAP